MTLLDSMAQPNSSHSHVPGKNQVRSAGVLLGTIAATGSLGLAVVFAVAPTTEALLLVCALGLPWALLAIAATLSLASTPARPRVVHVHVPARRPARVPAPAFRLAAATVAIAILLLAGLVVQHASIDSAANTHAALSPTGTTAQVAAADLGAD